MQEKMMLLKKLYDKLVAKLNAIPLNNTDTSNFVLKTKYKTDKTELENEIPDVTDFVKKAGLTKLENNIPELLLRIKYLMLVIQLKKTDYNTKITEI